MLKYCIQRILLFFPTLLGIVLLTFVIIQFVPGGPIEQVIAKRLGTHVSESSSGQGLGRTLRQSLDQEEIDHLKKLYGFDKPWYERLGSWVWRLFTFDFGQSYYHHRDVLSLLRDKLPVSMTLGILSFFLSYLICIPLGIKKAVVNGSRFDTFTSVAILFGYSVPGFVLGVFLIVFFAGSRFWNFFPLRGLVSDNFSQLSSFDQFIDYLRHIFLPLICVSMGSFAVLTQLTKTAILEHINQQYVLTASAKGLHARAVVLKHVMRNALIPLITGFSNGFLMIFFGQALLIETLFSLDGLGLLSYQSVLNRDYPVVMANLFIFSLLYLIGNLISDILYVVVDPRISFERKD